MNYDLIIIGAGPAGLSASVYAARYKINHVVIGELPGGLMSEAHKICNYPSEVEISGFDLGLKMKEHAEKLGTEILMTRVTEIIKTAEGFEVKTANQQSYNAKTILLATGTIHNHLNLPNEGKFVGHGLAYCATCDAMFYRNKITAVVGSGNSAMTAALHLSEVATKVYQIVRGGQLKGEVMWIEQVKNNPKIEIVFNTQITGLIGEDKLTGFTIDKPYNNQDIINVDGLFVEIGSTPATSWFDNLGLKIDDRGYVEINRDQSTSLNGVFAAGDITNGSNNLHQIITACAEGAIAAGGIFQYLQKSK